MNFRRWLIVRLICMVVFNQNAFGAVDLHVFPWQTAQATSTGLSVGYGLPCGFQKVGFVYNQDKDGTMKLGVVARSKSVACTAMPRAEKAILPSLKLHGVQEISQFDEEEVTHLRLDTPVQVKNLNGHPEMMFEPKCGLVVGTVIDEQDRKGRAPNLRIAALEAESSAAKAARCSFHQIVRRLPEVNSTELTELAALSLQKTTLERAMRIKIVPAVVISQSGANGLTLEYQRHCNESPLGPVLSAPASAPRWSHHKLAKPSQEVGVGFLVAEYYNLRCEGHVSGALVGASFTEKWEGPLLHTNSATTFVAMRERSENLTLRSPSRFRDSKKSTVSFDYLADCGGSIGAVYSRDSSGHLAVGILQDTKSGACTGSVRARHMEQAIAVSELAASSLYPLRVKGL